MSKEDEELLVRVIDSLIAAGLTGEQIAEVLYAAWTAHV